MLVFIDESGDTGRKIAQGSSRYFVVSLVLFKDHDEAQNCDQRIELLKSELGRDKDSEFHFQDNSEGVRMAFLEAVSRYDFTYFAVIIDKDPKKLFGPGFEDKNSFYKYACSMVFSNAEPYLSNVIVVLDKSGSARFRAGLKRYLNLKTSEGSQKTLIKKLKQQDSRQNNLLQLADYVSGVINRKCQNKPKWRDYYKYLQSREVSVQKWPK